MATRLLDEQELARLVTLPVDACGEVLGHAGLVGLATDFRASRYLEQSIIGAQLDDLIILMRAASDGRRFLQYWTLRFEMSNLKAIVRGRLSGTPASVIRRELSSLGFLQHLPVDDLLSTENFEELMRRLESTPYGDMVRFARRASGAQPGLIEPGLIEHSLFDFDAALDRRFYHGLTEQARPLEESLGLPFRRLMEWLIDRVNLNWLLRFRFTYALPPAQVYYMLVPSQYRLSSGVLKDLSPLTRLEDVLASLPQPYRGWLHGKNDVNATSTALDAHVAGEMRALLRSAAPAFARAFAYLVLRDRDLRRIRAILKGRSLGLDTPVIAQAAGLDEQQIGRAA